MIQAKKSLRRCAFTLLELLVILALLVLLAALMMPPLTRARENANRAACASNLQRIGIALKAYATDYDDRLPANWGTLNVSWDMRLLAKNYLPAEVLKCPSDTARPGDFPSGCSACGPAWPGVRSYAIAGGGDCSRWFDGASLSCPALSNTAVIAIVSERPSALAGCCDYSYFCNATSAYGQVESKHDRENKSRTNYLFLDWHVAWVQNPTDGMFPRMPASAKCP
jgi:prepilin-type processing-associated H-X9-DG protein